MIWLDKFLLRWVCLRLGPSSAVLLLFGLVPGMPNLLFAGAAISGAIAWVTSKGSGEINKEEIEEEKDENHEKLILMKFRITRQYH